MEGAKVTMKGARVTMKGARMTAEGARVAMGGCGAEVMRGEARGAAITPVILAQRGSTNRTVIHKPHSRRHGLPLRESDDGRVRG